MREKLIALWVLMSVFSCQAEASAHGVAIEYRSIQALEVKAAYDTGEPMVNAQVAVFSPTDPAKPWQTGTTDARGHFLFTPDTPGSWEVQVRQAGHGEVVVIPVKTVAASSEAEPSSAAPSNSSASNLQPTSAYTPLQKGLMIGAVLWGCVGTALFFWRGKRGYAAVKDEA